MFWPFGAAQVDPEKPMCIGVQTTVWGDGNGSYTGKCRYGAPLGPMQAAIRQMDRRSAVANARENGLPQQDGERLQAELDTIARLPVVQGRARLKRHARNETLAAKGDGEAPRPSWLRRAAVNCAIWGAIAAETTLLYEVTVNRKLPTKELAKNAAMGCAMAVITPGVGKWIKAKGYDLGA